MGPTDRRAREKAQTEQRILDAARRLFAEQGYEAVTLRGIAQAIEYTPAAIYKHFKDKEELVRELCSRDVRLMFRDVPRLLAIPNPVARIAHLGLGYIRFGVEHPEHYRLMFMNPSEAWWNEEDEENAPELSPQEDGYEVLLAATKQAIAEGRFRSDFNDADLVAQTLWAGVHGVTSLHVAMRANKRIAWADVDARAKTMIRMQMAGVCRAEEAPAIEEALR